MVRVIGDIWPAASGSSSLGVDQTACCPIGDEIRPFNHIHQNSGVFHDPIHGTSGVIRFNGRDESGIVFETLSPGQIPSLEFSFDGGRSFPLRLGQALKNSLVFQNQDVVIQTLDGLPLQLKSSGLLDLLSEASINLRSVNGSIIIDANGASSDVNITSDNNVNITSTDDIQILATNGNFNLGTSSVGGNTTLSAGPGDVTVSAGVNAQAGGQTKLQPFGGSGQLEYRLGGIGGHEAWHWSPNYDAAGGPNSDGFHPIPHSGQIFQMIQEQAPGIRSLRAKVGSPTTEADITLTEGGGISIDVIASDEIEFVNTGTLQRAYDNGQTIFIDSAQDLQIAAGNHKLKLGTNGDKAEINMSGLLTYPSSDLELGDVNMIVHGQEPLHGGITTPTSQAEAQALSLGIGIPVINTGSGIINVSVGSCVGQFFNTSNQTLSTSATNINFTSAGNNIPDGHFISSSINDIQILVPGLYRLWYAASAEKTSGSTGQRVDAAIKINAKTILGSDASCILNDSTNLKFNTANGLCMFDANAGDIVAMTMTLSNSPGGNSVRAVTRRCNILIEWIGVRRGTLTAL